MAEGNYAGAAENFKTAASLLRTNAQVWNYLGLACHHAGQFTNAERAYLNALALDRDLAEAHYNLGCMRLEQNQPDFGKSELTAYTSLRPNSAAGWVKLGAACLRGGDLVQAEARLKDALRLESQNVEALNDLGMVQSHRNRPRDAAQTFESALRLRPDYGPALLNLAIVLHVNLNNRSLALQKYRAYLALTPRPANWEAVNVVATELNQLLNPAPAPMPTNSPPINRTNTGTPRASLVATQSVISSKPVALPTTTRTSVVVSAAPPVEVTQVSTQRVVQPVQQLAASRSTAPPAPVTNAAPAIAAATKSEKRTVLQRINPLNLFRRNKGASPSATASNTVALRTPAGGELTLPRYEYHPLEVPAEGDHAGAEPVFAEGVQAERANDLPKAVQSYRRAAELDPAYFDAQYRLGIASAGAGNLPQALRAYETALTIQPESVDARISFSQALKQANYPLDAAAQLEEVLTTDPNNARAHLNLGNLYAQQLRQPARAREHYLKVLELDPRNPRASDIRFWLAANPP